jgi:predicted nucleic acid-binding protein
MTAERFTLDTNILIYSIDARDPLRQRLAAAVVHGAVGKDCILTNQAIVEFYSAATRRLKISPARAAVGCRDFLQLFDTVTYDRTAVDRALTEAVAGRMAFWDALLVATAEGAGCTVVLSEDMADGARFGSATIRHPFAGNALSMAARRLTAPPKP